MSTVERRRACPTDESSRMTRGTSGVCGGDHRIAFSSVRGELARYWKVALDARGDLVLGASLGMLLVAAVSVLSLSLS